MIYDTLHARGQILGSVTDAGQRESEALESVCDGVFVVGAAVDCAGRREVYSIGVAEVFSERGMVETAGGDCMLVFFGRLWFAGRLLWWCRGGVVRSFWFEGIGGFLRATACFEWCYLRVRERRERLGFVRNGIRLWFPSAFRIQLRSVIRG